MYVSSVPSESTKSERLKCAVHARKSVQTIVTVQAAASNRSRSFICERKSSILNSARCHLLYFHRCGTKKFGSCKNISYNCAWHWLSRGHIKLKNKIRLFLSPHWTPTMLSTSAVEKLLYSNDLNFNWLFVVVRHKALASCRFRNLCMFTCRSMMSLCACTHVQVRSLPSPMSIRKLS